MAEVAPFLMVVAIVAIVSFTRLQRAKYGVGKNGEALPMRDPDADRLRDEVRALKERVAVLERIATDANGRSTDLDREIEALRKID